jgi:hypothetical protein
LLNSVSIVIRRRTLTRRDKILKRLPDAQQDKLIQFIVGIGLFRKFLKRYFNPITRISFEWRSFRIVVKIVYDLFIK